MTTPAADAPLYRAAFRALRDDLPPPARLSRLLRYALRTCAFRCVSVEEVVALPEPAVRGDEEEGE